MNKFAIMVHFTTHYLSFLCCSSRGRTTWTASAMDGRRKYGGYGACFKHFLVGIPIESRYRTPSVTKQSVLKCLERSIEYFDGPSQLLHSSNPFCLQILLTRKSMQTISFATLCIIHPAATQRLGIVIYVAIQWIKTS